MFSYKQLVDLGLVIGVFVSFFVLVHHREDVGHDVDVVGIWSVGWVVDFGPILITIINSFFERVYQFKCAERDLAGQFLPGSFVSCWSQFQSCCCDSKVVPSWLWSAGATFHCDVD